MSFGSGADVGPPILVTGSHRSGTTWTGRVLASAPGLAYVDEPFRPDQRPGILDAGIDRWFAYAPDLDEKRLELELGRLLEGHYAFRAEMRALEKPRDLLRMLRDAFRFVRRRLRGDRVLLKDPIAVFSSAWIADTFDARVVVMVRHPAAFALSLKEKGWTHPFEHFLEQPRLMRNHLASYRRSIERFAREERSVVEQAALLWTLTYHVVSTFLRDRPSWIVVRHEDLAADPTPAFRDLFERLELPWTADTRRFLRSTSGAENPTRPSGRAKDVRRDSRGLVGRWRDRLGNEEIDVLRRWAGDLASEWYAESSWE